MSARGKKLAAVALALCLAVCFAVPALAVVQPTQEFYVADYAGVLSSSTESDILEKNNYLYNETGAQIVVVTVDSADGLTLEEYGYQLANEWGIGSSSKDNGVLLLLSIGDDDYQCMQGRGLEDQLPTTTLSRILQEQLEPDFAARDYDAGVRKTFNTLYNQVCGIYGLKTDGAADYNGGAAPDYTYGHEAGVVGGLSVIGLIIQAVVFLVVIIVVISVISSLLRPRRHYTQRPYDPYRTYDPYGSYRGGGGYSSSNGFWSGFLGGMIASNSRNRRRRPPRGPFDDGFGSGFGGFGGPSHRGGGSFGGGSFRSGGGGRSGGSFRSSGGGGSFRGGGAGRGH